MMIRLGHPMGSKLYGRRAWSDALAFRVHDGHEFRIVVWIYKSSRRSWLPGQFSTSSMKMLKKINVDKGFHASVLLSPPTASLGDHVSTSGLVLTRGKDISYHTIISFFTDAQSTRSGTVRTISQPLLPCLWLKVPARPTRSLNAGSLPDGPCDTCRQIH